MSRKCAIYSRVSTEEQYPENQIRQLKNYCFKQDFNVTKIYVDKFSGRVTNRPHFQEMLKDARLHKFDILLVWSLDRFSREGIRNNLNYLNKLKKYNIGFKSYTEPLIDTTNEGVGEIILAILSWVAEREAVRISERTKAGLERARAEGKKLGRPQGSKDSKKRNKIGYYKRWEK
jgi:putative DNA-invertase from lambdoid prophage Rac